jgi:hypothetical protein
LPDHDEPDHDEPDHDEPDHEEPDHVEPFHRPPDQLLPAARTNGLPKMSTSPRSTTPADFMIS